MVREIARRFAAAAMLLAGVMVASIAHAQKEEFVVGGVLSLSGPLALAGEAMKKGVDLAVEMRGGKVLGVPVKVRWEDDEGKPQATLQKATKLDADGAQILFGAVTSATTTSMLKLAERRKIPLLVTFAASDEITGKEGNRWVFRTSNSADMDTRMMVEYAVANKYKRVYGLMPDIAVGHQIWAEYPKLLAAHGIEVVGVDYAPIGTKDFALIIDKISKTNADGVTLALIGADLVTFLKQAGQVQLNDKTKIFGMIVMDELIGQAVGDASYGVASTLRYHSSFDNPANKAFVAAYQTKYGELPSAMAGEAFDGMAWLLDVINATNSWDREVWIKAFKASKRENSVEGLKVMRSCNNQAQQVGLYGKAVKGTPPQPPVVMQITHTFPADKLFEGCK
jgi:ABC-type branched-subunit amino acid transport system substrate-binding protein